ncbi:M1 family metallopeptidase [Flavobacterium algicola]|uniref:M1 family metallopeptidase n=1 Tax=Flavobacterium algicola TaxID=556529 RepID=UPI001EFEA037|nr:M1 family metallopeptidase [Flavobacterium algicola]MCG9792724.1 M1 family metallopeptidase [Flavobacterium algicola]
MKYLFLLLSYIAIGQQVKNVDFIRSCGKLMLNTQEKSISGEVVYEFKVLKAVDTIIIDAVNMSFEDVTLNGKAITTKNTSKALQLISSFKRGNYKLRFNYKAVPKQALYFVGDFVAGGDSQIPSQIWTQGQGRYTSNWYPSFDDVNEKVIFNIEVSFDKKYEVASNGVLESKKQGLSETVWTYEMQKPMSSYLLMLGIGEYKIYKDVSKSNIPMEMYLEKLDSAKFETTYRDSKKIFYFLESKIGVKYPWKVYRQIPVRDFLYAGMENTSATIFSSRYVVDTVGFADRSYTNVNAHELAHQWFGDLITAESGKHHWLQEGFATYYALLAEKELKGEDYFYGKMYESAQQIKYASRTDTIPILNEKASSLSFYQKGAWALFVLENAIGEKAFDKAVQSYLKKHQFQNVTTEDFFTEIRKVSDYDLQLFSKVWLEDYVFNTQQANDLLLKNKMIQLLFQVDEMKLDSLSRKEDFFRKILIADVSIVVKKAIINQLKIESWSNKQALFEAAMSTNDLELRQYTAALTPKITEEFRTQYESLLNDKSYQMQELALFNLWRNFPAERINYLEQSKDWMGFNDYNLRTLWLSLALSTSDYIQDKKPLVDELIQYSSPQFEAITRQNALEKLISFKIINDEVLINLVKATTHHMWQFSKFGRDTIRKMLKEEAMKTSFEHILPALNEAEKFQLTRLLKEL